MIIENSASKKPKAILLYSGGLDSTIVLYLLHSMGVNVLPVTFTTPFCNYSCSGNTYLSIVENVKKLGVKARTVNIEDEYLSLLRSPKHGFGSAANPCVDCRILMLKHAKEILVEEGADFIATGEVVGQRPFSQTRERFEVIDREAGVEGFVVRPLSGKLLPETIPEKKGFIKREDLREFKDKTRRSQIKLAKELGIETYPTPAGGCLLTEPAFGKRFKDLQKHNPQFSMEDAVLLRFGRHFRLNKDKIIVCRNQTENGTILNYISQDDILFELVDYNGPLCVFFGELTEYAVVKAASYAVSYSKAPKDRPSKVRFWNLKGTFQKVVEAYPLPLEKIHKNLI